MSNIVASGSVGAEAQDERFMAMALMLARRGWGATMPNPAVGAVLVQGSGEAAQIVGQGWTQPGGRPHAEVEALAHAGDRARGATLYVTLEPCSHVGRSPPCADAVVKAGVASVVAGAGDPDRRVAGRGFARLRAAGIKTTTGVLADAARWVTAGHILRVAHHRPFITLKLAVSADGRIAAGTGAPVWVTGPMARARGHLERARHDAIMVGIGTVLADDPSLTCRLPGLSHRSPRPVVLDSALRIPLSSTLIAAADTNKRVDTVGTNVQTPIIMSAPNQAPDRLAALQVHAVQLLAISGSRSACGKSSVDGSSHNLGQPRGLSPADVASALAEQGITRVLIEGGPGVARSFLGSGMVDEAIIFRGQDSLGKAGLPALVDHGLDEFGDVSKWQVLASRHLAGDSMTIYRNLASMALLRST